MRRVFRNNGLTIVLLVIFLGTWAGQFFAGHDEYNESRREHGLAAVGLCEYFTSGHFWQATGENWESEFLQMGMFVLLTCRLFQKGSPESRDPDEQNDPLDADPRLRRWDPRAPWPVRRGGWALRIYSNSLSLCFLLLFVISFALHAWGGAKEHNEEQREHGRPAVSVVRYVGSSRFWFEAMQNWQSEFLSLAAMVYLSVYLRQQGSAESKPVATPHDESGDEEPTVDPMPLPRAPSDRSSRGARPDKAASSVLR